MDSTTVPNNSSGTQALQRTLRILDLLSHEHRPMSLSKLTEATGFAKSTVHRLVRTLADANYVSAIGDGYYRLGPALVRLGNAASQWDRDSTLLDVLDRLATASGDTAFHSLRAGTLSVCTERREGNGPIRNFVLHPGDRHPLGIGAGSLAILAALDDDEADRIRHQNLAVFSANSALGVVEADGRLDAALNDARDSGYAVNRGMLEPSSWAIGMAVRDSHGTPVGALSIGTIEPRLGPDRISELVQMLTAETSNLEDKMLRKEDR